MPWSCGRILPGAGDGRKCYIKLRLMGTLHGEQLCDFLFASLHSGSTLKGNNLLPSEQILSFKSRPHFHFVRASLSKEANRKSKKLFPFVKMVENQESVPIHPKS